MYFAWVAYDAMNIFCYLRLFFSLLSQQKFTSPPIYGLDVIHGRSLRTLMNQIALSFIVIRLC